MMRSIYIVDDDDVVRASLYALLSVYENTVLRCFASGDAFLEQLPELTAAPVLLDMHMPGASGMDVLAQLRDRPDLVPIILTGQGDIQLAVQSMKTGALDFLEKPYEPDHLLQLVDAAFARLEVTEQSRVRLDDAQKKIGRLSAREQDVLKGLISGMSNKVIAYELDISPRTVEVYRANMMEKLEVQSLSEALRIAFAAGLVEA